eukprot:15457723-Alexandrium_andersonii.AAC.1
MAPHRAAMAAWTREHTRRAPQSTPKRRSWAREAARLMQQPLRRRRGGKAWGYMVLSTMSQRTQS